MMEHVHFDLAASTWWIYALSVILGSAASWYTYTRVDPQQTPFTLATLRILRALGLASLLLLLFEPILRIVQSETVRPRVALLIDESRSLPRLAKMDTTALRATVATLQSTLGADIDVELYGFSDVLREVQDIDSLTFRGYRTDIASGLSAIANRSIDRRIGAIVLVTDGQHNGSDSPVMLADNLGLGVYSVGFGDTVMPKDFAVTRILVAGIGVVREPMPVTVDIESYRVPDGDYEMVIEDNGARVSSQRVTVRSNVPRQTVTMDWKPAQEGVRKLVVALRPVDGEATTANNRVQAFVDVRSYKRKVVLIAGAPSPDVAFIKTSLTRDPSVVVSTFVQKQGAEFYEGTPSLNDLADIEALVLVGFPTTQSSAAVVETIAKACSSGTALFFMPSVQLDYRKLGSLESILPFRVTGSRPQEFLVTPDVTDGSASDPIMRLSGDVRDAATWKSLPPMFRTETFVESAPGAQVLATIRVGNAALEEPLIMKRDDGRTRSIAVLGYGLYRWRLLGTAPQQARGGTQVDVLDAFLGNAVSWLRVRDSERRIVIAPTQKFYATGEPVGFVASVQDESFAAVNDAEVRVVLTTSTGPRSVVLALQGNGRYATTVGSLPPGDYSFVGTATRGSVQLATRRGRFTVGDLQVEDVAQIRNAPLLNSMAQRTGGLAISIDKLDTLREMLKRDPRLRDVVQTRDREYPVYHLPWLVVLAIGCFAAEWTLRKRRGLV